MPQTIESALAQATFYSDDQPYALVHLPSRAITAAAGVLAEIGEAFTALIVDKDEITLILRAADLDDFAHRLPGHQQSETHYRLITIDVVLEATLTGFMARISTALAAAHIPIIPIGAFSRDHLLVPKAHFVTAISVLETLKSSLT